MADATLELVGMPIPVFTVGPPQRPRIVHDDGFLGRFPPRRPTANDYAELTKWIGRLEVGEAIQGLPFLPKNDLPDALAAYRHFLFGHGKDRTFSYERYVQNDDSGRETLKNATFQAQMGAEELWAARSRRRPGAVTFQMTSTIIPCGADPEESPWGDLYPYPATENWQKAIGAHYLWLSAQVAAVPSGLQTRMVMHLIGHAEDRYNFNPDNADIATGIPDDDNGRFELAGLGHQYTNYSTINRVVRWTARLASVQEGVFSESSAGRQRRPTDNRRLRNRL